MAHDSVVGQIEWTIDPTATDPYKFSLVGAVDSPIVGGIVHRANAAAFPVLKGVAVFSLRLDPGAERVPHFHPNANEISLIVSGQARVGLVLPGGEQHVFELGPGELAYQPAGCPHWLEAIGNDPVFAYFSYSHEQPTTIDMKDVGKKSGQK